MKKVIIIPGLGSKTGLIKTAMRNWHKHGIETIFYSMEWRNGEDFETKLNKLLKFTDQVSEDESKIGVIGCSAGASAALNLFIERQNVIDKVINVCGRIRVGNPTGFRSLENKARTSSAFAESVKLFEGREKFLTKEQRSKIMTVRAYFGDELVPADTVTIEGAKNIVIPSIEHACSIFLALSIFSKSLINFILSK